MADLRTIVANYEPSPEIIEAIKTITLVAVIGPACVGKTTLIKLAVEHDPSIHLVLSYTSRLARPGEVNGVEYNFQTKLQMIEQLKKQEFVQVAPLVSDDLYASRLSSFGQPGGTAILAVWATALEQFRQLPFRTLRTIFITPPDFSEWQRRLSQRTFSAELLQKRMIEAKNSFSLALKDKNLQFIINDELNLAEANFLQLIRGEMNPELLSDQSKARQIIASILSQIK
jgi:guanylate kinase